MRAGDLANITTLSFDGDATLWDFEKVMRYALGRVLEKLRRQVPGPATTALSVEKMIEIRDAVARELQDEIINLDEIRQRAFARTVEHIGQKDGDLAAHLNRTYRKHRFEHPELYPDAIPTLEALSPHFQLGLLSNGNSHPDRMGLGNCFAFVVFSQDVGIAKPDARIFEATAARAGCQVSQLLHVGDALETDVAGANGAGVTSVWLNRDHLPNQTDFVPDYEISALDELLPLLKVKGEKRVV